MIFRLSQKVAAKIKEPNLQTMPPDMDPFADWHVGMFIHERLQYLIFVNSASLFTVVLRGAGVKDFELLYISFRSVMLDVLKEAGAPHLFDRIFNTENRSITPAKATDRHLIGSMNDQVKMAKYDLDEDMPIGDIITRLNKVPMRRLKEYYIPRIAFMNLEEGGALTLPPAAERNPVPEAPGIKGRHLRLWTPEEG
jgi:hypothetical protein